MKLFKMLLGTCLVSLFAANAFAQEETPKYEVFTGYGYVRPEGGKGNLNGWHASFTTNMNNWFGIAMELSGQYGTQTLSVTSAGRTSQVKADANFHSLGFGPRFTYRKNDRLTPFVHVLFGIARADWKRPAIVSGEETSFGAAAGGGFDTQVSDHFSLRIIQAEYVRTHFSGHPQKNFRMATGVLFSF